MYDFGFTNGPVIMESNLAKLQINDARYHEVMLSLHHFQGIHQVISLNITLNIVAFNTLVLHLFFLRCLWSIITPRR